MARVFLFALIALAGCNLDTEGAADADVNDAADESDARDGSRPDADAPDAGEDAGVDAGEDAGVDAGEDAGIDAGEDASLDAAGDAPDEGIDAGDAEINADATEDATPDATEPNECDPDPCSNGGVCVDGDGTYTCTCTTGFGGTNCQIQPLVVTTGSIDLGVFNSEGRSCSDGGDMVAYSVVGLTANSAMLQDDVASGCLAPDDHVLLLQMRGTTTSDTNVGNFEVFTVASVSADTVVFTTDRVRTYGGMDIGLGGDMQRVVLVRIPQYYDVTVAAGAELTAPAWDGRKGGVLTFEAAGTLTVAGRITMAGRGYRGGGTTTAVNTAGQPGESINGRGMRGRAANRGGGGGGAGDGTMSCPTQGFAGGGGAHFTAATNASTACGGTGGAMYGMDLPAQLFMGSGGGAGGTDNVLTDNPPGGRGGAGGGIIAVSARVLAASTFDASGGAGQGDTVTDCMGLSGSSTTSCWDYCGPGGGGGGGTVFVAHGPSPVTPTVDVSGGAGGLGRPAIAGVGGQGGAGRSALVLLP